MRKRRERMEAWRQMRQKEEEEEAQAKMESQNGEEAEGETEETKRKGWTLEDDDEDDEADVVPMDDENAEGEGGAAKDDTAQKGAEEEIDEDVDPLDRFMVGVQKEVKEINTAFQKKTGAQLSSGKMNYDMCSCVIALCGIRTTGKQLTKFWMSHQISKYYRVLGQT